MRCLRRCESVGFSGNGGRSSSSYWGGGDVKRAEKWLNNRELEGLEYCVRDIGEVERIPTWDASGRMGDDLSGLKVLKNRSRGKNRRIMDVEQ
jgi:hypothetical protein